jgi:hypothetical protein
MLLVLLDYEAENLLTFSVAYRLGLEINSILTGPADSYFFEAHKGRGT